MRSGRNRGATGSRARNDGQHGQPQIVESWLEKLTRGEALVAIALTEPRGGSDAANLRLRVERAGDE